MDRSVSLGSGLDSLSRIFFDNGPVLRSSQRCSSFSDLMLAAPAALSELPESVAFRESLQQSTSTLSSPHHHTHPKRGDAHVVDDNFNAESAEPPKPLTTHHTLLPKKSSKRAMKSHESKIGSGNLMEVFENSLGEEVCTAMQAAAEVSGELRTEMLNDLLGNTINEIEYHVKEKLTAAYAFLPPECTHYFHLIAAHFGRAPPISPATESFYTNAASASEEEKGAVSASNIAARQIAAILPAFSRLWSHDTFSPVFALLFHLWFLAQSDDIYYTVELGSHFAVLLNGANRLFWHDLLAGTRVYATVYATLLRACTHPSKLTDVPLRIRSQFYEIIFRFALYYEAPDTLKALLLQIPSISELADLSEDASDAASLRSSARHSSAASHASHSLSHAAHSISATERAELRGGLLNPKERCERNVATFIHELCRHIRGIRSEQGVLVYLTALPIALRDLNLDVHSANRLQALLTTLATPGAPLYPTRKVRHTAQATMDAVFPTGRLARRLVHICFRLLHPLTWPKSLLMWFSDLANRCIQWMARTFGCFSVARIVKGTLTYRLSRRCCRWMFCKGRNRKRENATPENSNTSTQQSKQSSASGKEANQLNTSTQASASSLLSQHSSKPLLLDNSTAPHTSPASIDDDDLSVWEYVSSSYSVSVLLSSADYVLAKVVGAIPILAIERTVYAIAKTLGRG